MWWKYRDKMNRGTLVKEWLGNHLVDNLFLFLLYGNGNADIDNSTIFTIIDYTNKQCRDIYKSIRDNSYKL